MTNEKDKPLDREMNLESQCLDGKYPWQLACPIWCLDRQVSPLCKGGIEIRRGRKPLIEKYN